MSKIYNNKRQLKTLIRKYKKLCDKKEQEILKDKHIQESLEFIKVMIIKQGIVINLCDEIISQKGRGQMKTELRQFATRIKANIS